MATSPVYLKESSQDFIYDIKEWLDQRLGEGRPLRDDDPESTPVGWRCQYEEVFPHLVSARKFLSENDVDIRATDLRFLSAQYRCGGEADAMGMVNGTPYLLEFKTSSQPSRAHAVQVCTYKAGLRLRGIGCMIVCLTKDGYRAVTVNNERACLDEWLRLRKCWEFAKDETPWVTACRGRCDVFDDPAEDKTDG